MKVYGSSGWQNAGSSVNGTSQRYNYTATSGQTTFTGADNNGNTLTYDAGYIDVYLNGVKLLNGTDVTVTSGSSVVLASGATTGDVVDIVAYGTFSVASLNADNLDSGTVPDARITGAYTGITNLTMSGDLTVDTNTLKVDSTNNRVGIGTSSPSANLHLREITSNTTTASDQVKIQAESSGTTGVGFGTNILFLGERNGGTLQGMGRIGYVASTNTSSNLSSDFVVQTASAGTPTERMRIDSSGNFMVGTTDNTIYDNTSGGGLCYRPSLSLDIAREATSSGNYMLSLNNTGVDAKFINFGKDGTGVGSIGTKDTDLTIGNGGAGFLFLSSENKIRPFNVSTNSATDNVLTLGRSNTRFADLYLGGGLYVGGTGTANKLEDYEEGTYTPTYSASGGGSANYAGRTGNYVKVGKIVHIQIRLMTTTESFSGDITVTGLPFTSDSTSWHQTALSINGARLGTDMPNLNAYIVNNVSEITLEKGATNAYSASPVTDADLVNNTNYNILRIAGSYEIS
ncbi:hypothetical protein HTVC304P_gp42 [Pelagibacter phage HTVC304P]|nr:hypothetical protein HTVC304P_gp42 [Pelagibacter phage HTVC304P]